MTIQILISLSAAKMRLPLFVPRAWTYYSIYLKSIPVLSVNHDSSELTRKVKFVPLSPKNDTYFHFKIILYYIVKTKGPFGIGCGIRVWVWYHLCLFGWEVLPNHFCGPTDETHKSIQLGLVDFDKPSCEPLFHQ